DAVRGLRPVQRGRRRALDDLDRLDDLRADVVQPRGRSGVPDAQRDVVAGSGIVDAHAVDVDERLARQHDGTGATDADIAAATDGSAAGRDVHARHAAREHRLEVWLRRYLLFGRHLNGT